jgi:hypothetical protein
MSLTPLFAEAAGLGKLTVLSGLGQPLRAELDIGATKDELAGMSARWRRRMCSGKPAWISPASFSICVLP